MILRIALLLALFFKFSFITAATGEQFRVVGVIAGDLIIVQSQTEQVSIRLMGIDSPENPRKKGELGQPYSREATEYLTNLVFGKTVEIENWGKDRYGQKFGVVFLDGENVNLKMVKSGLAEVYRGRMRKDFNDIPYKAVEMQARHSQIGMWSTGNIYISPRVWRQRHR
jgi:endonuclease YncB( thermonuclease family)